MTETQFQQLLAEKGIALSPQQLEQFATYYEWLVEWNEKVNLTAITDKQDVYEKHFYDSITVAFTDGFDPEGTLCDVGSGAGFPSIPLKICFPSLHISIVDSLKKRITFLEHLVDALQLEGVQLYHDRAETFGQNKTHRQAYDTVTARAVAKLSILSEFCLPLVKVGGTFVAMKGAQATDELQESKKGIATLGGAVRSVETMLLPEEQSERQIVIIEKDKATPKKYPRKPGIPKKNPL